MPQYRRQPGEEGRSSSAFTPARRKTREPRDEFTRTLNEFREFELVTLYTHVCRIPEVPKARAWRTVSGIAFGGFIGTIPGLFPLLDPQNVVEGWVIAVYCGITAVLLVASILCFLAARGMHAERSVSMSELKEDFRRVLRAYGIEPDGDTERVSEELRLATRAGLSGGGGVSAGGERDRSGPAD